MISPPAMADSDTVNPDDISKCSIEYKLVTSYNGQVTHAEPSAPLSDEDVKVEPTAPSAKFDM